MDRLTGKLATLDAIRAYMEAGHGTLTIRSKESGTRFTFKLVRPYEDSERVRPIWVRVLTGPDNTSDYEFLGTIWPDGVGPGAYRYGHGRAGKTRVAVDAPSAQAIAWLCRQLALDRAAAVFQQAEVWHEGVCGRCGRRLTVPESVESGFGPECIQHVRRAA